MQINTFEYTGEVTPAIERVLRRSETDISGIKPTVEIILAGVRDHGDEALRRFTAEFDKVDLGDRPLRVTDAEREAAIASLDPELKAAMDACAANIRKFHEAQMPTSVWFEEIQPGVFAGEKITPIDTMALYVPRGKGAFPSVMMMLGIPAAVAKVPRVVIVTPPTPDGGVDAATCYGAHLAGHTEIYRIGGAQAIAALAYGTQSVPRADKVLGPGNQYVTAAKRLLSDRIDPGIPAGPSESVILCDETADPDIAARDLLIEAEHGPDSTALLVTHSAAVAEGVAGRLAALADALPEQRRGFIHSVFATYGGIVRTRSLDDSIAFTNLFAPEHLEVLTRDPMAVMQKLKHAGEILLGPHAPITIGNFSLGVNAILPTGGHARTASCLTVHDFTKRTSIGYITEEGYKALAGPALKLADYEGFPSHAAALRYRTARTPS